MQAVTEFLRIVTSDAECGRVLALNVILKLSLSLYLQEKELQQIAAEAKFPSLRCSHIAKENPGLKAGDHVVLHGENHLNVKVLLKVPGG